ncbi:MAG: hypothetical protein AABY22_17775 [Nanoarchaeota archaeon]
MILISVSGKANTGKNTLSKLLADEVKSRLSDWNGNVFIAFADPIKEIVKIMFPNLPRKYLFGSSEFRNKQIPGKNRSIHAFIKAVNQWLIFCRLILFHSSS